MNCDNTYLGVNLMGLEGNDMQITTKWLTVEPVTSSVSVIRLQLAVLQVHGIVILFFIVRVVVPEVVLNLISSDPQEVPA